MSERLESANVDMWNESLATSVPSFFGVLSDVIHVIILIAFLTQTEVGLFFVCYAFLYLFSQIPRGFGIAIRRRVAEVNNGRSEYLWAGLLLTLPSLLGVFFVFWLLQPFIATYLQIVIPSNVLIAFYLATIGFSVLELARYYVAGCGNPALAEKLRTGIAKTSMPVITVLFLSYTPSVSYGLYAVFVAYFGTSIIILGYSEHSVAVPRKTALIGILNFSKWSILTSLLNDVYMRFDTIMLSAFVGAAAVGYYESSLRIAFLSTTFAIGISKTSNVKMSGLFETGEDITEIASKTFIASPVLILPLLMVSVFNADYLLQILYSSEYAPASLYLILLIVVQLFQGYRVQFESIFNSCDEPRYNTRISLFTVIVNIITAPILVHRFGGLGVLYSTILAEMFRLFLYEIRVQNVLDQYILPKSTLIQYGIFILLLGILEVIHTVFKLSDSASLLVSSFFGTLLFYSLFYLLSADVREIVSQYRLERASPIQT